MIPALWGKLRADIRSNKLQFTLIGGMLSLSAMLLTVSLLVLISADDPWQRTFEATNGPHVWIVSHQYDIDFNLLLEDPQVTESTGVLSALSDKPLVLGDEKIAMFLYAMDEPPSVARPLVAEGRWIDPANFGEIVLDYSLARFYDLGVGDTVTILGAEGEQRLSVVGLAVTAHWFPYDEITKDSSPGVAYLSRATLETLQPDQEAWFAVVGLRLQNPDNSKAFVSQTYDRFPGQLTSVLEWQYIQETSTLASTLNAAFMGLFSVLGLAAVGMIIFNTISGQVLSQYREIGLLKAVGVSPSQVTLLFLGEHLSFGLAAAVLGILLGLGVAPGLVNTMADTLNTTPPDIYNPGLLVGVLLVVEAAVALATILPAWQGGRIDTVQAISTGYRARQVGASRLGQLAGWLRLPPVILLGIKDTFTRPLRAILAILSLVLTIMVAVTAVNAHSTALDLAADRYYFNGTTADMRVMRNFVPQEVIKSVILDQPAVVDYYSELLIYGQAPGQYDQPIAVRMLGENYIDFDLPIKEGRMIAAQGEAVAGYAVMALLGLQIGDQFEVTVEGIPMQLTLVGRHTESLNLNTVVITSLATYQAQTDPQVQPSTYYLRLANPEQGEDLRREWLERFQGLINVGVIEETASSSVTQLRDLIFSMALILMLVAAANLMSTSLLSIRERVRDFGIQKTLGLTPAQIGLSVVTGAVTVAVIALLFGVTLGVAVMERFIQQVGIAIGAGTDYYTIRWGWIGLLLPILIGVAALSSLLPAVRAARLEVTEALRYE